MSRRRGDAPRVIVSQTSSAPEKETKPLDTSKTQCTCKCHSQPPNIPKDKCPGCFLVRVTSTLEPGDLYYNVKRETLFKRLSDDYHKRMGLAKGTVTFILDNEEVPWDSLDDFAKIFSISNKKNIKTNKHEGNQFPDYTLEAYVI